LQMVLLSTLGLILACVAFLALNAAIKLNTFLAGTGLNNTASHSVDQRSKDFHATVAVFEEHPFIGWSLGGVSSRLSERHGVPNNGKSYLGFPVIMDVLAASGVVGIIPFLLFLGINTIGMFSMIHRKWPEERAKWLRALVRGTIYLWMVLSVDQNVLRIYLWFHMSIVAAVALHLRQRSDFVTEDLTLPRAATV
jgi:O-antigen ligase